MRLALVVPALNEEDAIAGTLRRALASRQKVVANTALDQMIIVFVNDGSTDRTQEIVDQPEFDEVVKVRFEQNRGYGAAIKAGWQATDAELVGFIDGDGTCEPDFCINLVNTMLQKDADVVLAGRLSPETKMPLIRQVGNRLFAGLLGAVSGKDLTDSASGFRIVKRSSLKLMSPLPDGLHFTPAMSCICLLDPRLRIEEVHGMLYKEREGRSKLSVIRDGFRFLWTILFSACCYSPIKSMISASAIAAVVCGLIAGAIWGITQHGGAALLTVTAGLLGIMVMLGAGAVAHQLNYLIIGPRRVVGPWERRLQAMLNYRNLLVTGLVSTTVGILGMAGIGLVRSASDNAALVGLILCLLLTVAGVGMGILGVIVRVIWAVGEKQKSLIHDEFPTKTPVQAHSAAARNMQDDAPVDVANPLGQPTPRHG